MADEVIKKIRIPSAELPLIQFTQVYNPVSERNEINDLHYDFRYRIISENRNRTSAWSPIERIVMPDVGSGINPATELPYFPYTSVLRIEVSSSGNPVVVTAIWNKPKLADNPSDFENIFNKINIFDVWIRWTETNNATEESVGWTDWEFATTVSSNTFSIIKQDSAYKTIEVAIQIPTDVKLRDYNNNKLTLYRKFAAV